ncbi:MAG: hypothetical protein KKC11_01205 [Candidatus Omnitrophica bacterium]|nr:hypothetical protein [Candidatus Omnitrophota bacterium]MBU1367739.1 hypothetical protein [Candidatus Omnitrophota bacterium]MBU1810515.1 hypothetical protein [Candidatus Omnitrophota bacterium]MBU2436532.1 hypothetical protein [Candidatus Omnitrophota bacterium]
MDRKTIYFILSCFVIIAAGHLFFKLGSLLETNAREEGEQIRMKHKLISSLLSEGMEISQDKLDSEQKTKKVLNTPHVVDSLLAETLEDR